jgi:ABC-2 type transport system ATP-binding protein
MTPAARAPIITAREVTHRFGATVALDGASIAVRPGEIHVLLGPAGAGKTTLVAVLAGFIEPASGSVRVLGEIAARPRELSRSVGVVQAGDRTFYPHLSALENLVFFARLHGLRRREATALAQERLADVGLSDAACEPVDRWSPGMRKRLAIARAMLTDPAVLVVDEPARELDPDDLHGLRVLVSLIAARGTAVLWTTQRVEGIHGFADTVTFIAGGSIRYSGSVAGLAARDANRYVLRLRGTLPSGPTGPALLQRTLQGTATASLPRADDPEHVVLEPRGEWTIGDAIARLAQGGFLVLACRKERSELEESFLALSAEAAR